MKEYSFDKCPVCDGSFSKVINDAGTRNECDDCHFKYCKSVAQVEIDDKYMITWILKDNDCFVHEIAYVDAEPGKGGTKVMTITNTLQTMPLLPFKNIKDKLQKLLLLI